MLATYQWTNPRVHDRHRYPKNTEETLSSYPGKSGRKPWGSPKDNERMMEEGSPAGKEPVHGAEAPANSPTQGHNTLLVWNIQGGRRCQGESWMARQGD